jgi:hypothetical protein
LFDPQRRHDPVPFHFEFYDTSKSVLGAMPQQSSSTVIKCATVIHLLLNQQQFATPRAWFDELVQRFSVPRQFHFALLQRIHATMCINSHNQRLTTDIVTVRLLAFFLLGIGSVFLFFAPFFCL